MSAPEIIIILVVVVIIFGVGKVSKIGAHLGKAKREFKKGLDGKTTDDGSALESDAEFIDITPPTGDEKPNYDPKPGTRRDPIQDADLDSSSEPQTP